METLKKSNFLACILIRVEHKVQYDTVKYPLIEYQTHFGINAHFKLADHNPLEAKPIIL